MKIAYIIPSEDLLLGPDNELMIKGPLLVVPKEEFPAKHSISVNIGYVRTEQNQGLDGELVLLKEGEEKILSKIKINERIHGEGVASIGQ